MLVVCWGSVKCRYQDQEARLGAEPRMRAVLLSQLRLVSTTECRSEERCQLKRKRERHSVKCRYQNEEARLGAEPRTRAVLLFRLSFVSKQSHLSRRSGIERPRG